MAAKLREALPVIWSDIHASTTSSTAASVSSTARAHLQQPQPASLASQSLNGLLDRVRLHLRAERQAQQAVAGQEESTSFTHQATSRQAIIATGQPTATTPQPAAGTSMMLATLPAPTSLGLQGC